MKLPPVAYGTEAQEKLQALEKEVAKLESKNKLLEQEMLSSKKMLSSLQGAQSSVDSEEYEALRRENLGLTVGFSERSPK